MNKKQIMVTFTLILSIVILAIAFYWYGWRPTQIRKNCYDSIITNPFKTELEQQNESALQYQDCLKMNGLEK